MEAPPDTVGGVIETPSAADPTPVPGSAVAAEAQAPPAQRRGLTRVQANVIRAFCLWTVWVWATRIWNIWSDESRGAGFKAVHTVLAVVSVAFAVAVWLIVRRARSDAEAPSRRQQRH